MTSDEIKFYQLAWYNKRTKQEGENKRIYASAEQDQAKSDAKQLNKAPDNKQFFYYIIEI